MNLRKNVLMLIVAAITGFGAYKGYKESQTSKISDLMLENIEALASGEAGSQYFLRCWRTITCEEANLREEKTFCGNCTATVCTHWSDENICRR